MRQHRQALVDESGGGKGVQYDINSFAVRVGLDSLREVQGARAVDVLDTLIGQYPPLWLTGGGKDLGTTPLGDLDRGLADTSSRRMVAVPSSHPTPTSIPESRSERGRPINPVSPRTRTV